MSKLVAEQNQMPESIKGSFVLNPEPLGVGCCASLSIGSFCAINFCDLEMNLG